MILGSQAHLADLLKKQRKSLGSDNHSGVHPRILGALQLLNQGHSPAYGTDEVTAYAEKEMRRVFGASVSPFYVFNGTAANVLCLQALIESHEAILAASTSHLHMDECSAPEKMIGAKIFLIDSKDGKIRPEQIQRRLIRRGDQHYPQVKVVSITLPTEYGTCYSMHELQEIRAYTREAGLYLHIDGARLIYAAEHLKVELIELTEKLGADAVSFGGTKNGLLFGEIVLLYNEEAKKRFKYIRKQHMQLPSKMRFLSGQFLEFLREPQAVWREVAAHGAEVARHLESRLNEFPEVQITQKVQANSVFAIFPRTWLKALREQYFFYIWDEETFEVRLMISFDMQKSDIDEFVEAINKVRNQ